MEQQQKQEVSYVNDEAPSSKAQDLCENNFENLTEVCNEIHRQSLKLLEKWTPTLGESEKIDSFYETRIDELIKEASELEQVLTKQKQSIKEKVKGLTLTLMADNNRQ